MENLIPSIMVAVVFVVAIIFMFKRLKDYRKYLEALSLHIGNAQVGGFVGARLTGRYTEYDIRIDAIPPGKNTPPFVILNLLKPTTFTFAITRQGAVSRFFKGVGVVKAMQTGDPTFDQEYVLRTKEEMMARMIFADARVREAIDTLFAAGYSHVFARRGKIVAKKRTTSPQIENDLRPEVILPLLDALQVIASHVP